MVTTVRLRAVLSPYPDEVAYLAGDALSAWLLGQLLGVCANALPVNISSRASARSPHEWQSAGENLSIGKRILNIPFLLSVSGLYNVDATSGLKEGSHLT